MEPILSPISSLIMDGLILVLLLVTIIVSARLSLMLKAFRDSRQELNKSIHTLNKRIDKAEHAVEGMRAAAQESGRDLQALINEAKVIADELQLVNEAGGNMAARLERVAQSASRTEGRADNRATPAKPKVGAAATAGFAIRDSDMERDGNETGGQEDMSKAERELLEAMQGRK
jgi:uncharacterized protein YoxC